MYHNHTIINFHFNNIFNAIYISSGTHSFGIWRLAILFEEKGLNMDYNLMLMPISLYTPIPNNTHTYILVHNSRPHIMQFTAISEP